MKFYITILLLCITCVVLVWWPESIPSQYDIQIMLIQEGYDIKLDGVVGYNTRKAWEDYEIKKRTR